MGTAGRRVPKAGLTQGPESEAPGELANMQMSRAAESVSGVALADLHLYTDSRDAQA